MTDKEKTALNGISDYAKIIASQQKLVDIDATRYSRDLAEGIIKRVEFIEAEQQRRVPSEEVQRAIEDLIKCENQNAGKCDRGAELWVLEDETYAIAITALRQMQGWIPVSDENVPYPYDKDVLCLQENGSIFVAYCESDSGHWFCGYDKMADPTHWMEKPQPPKGEIK